MEATELTIDPTNVRVHGVTSKQALQTSLRDLGAGRSILVDREGVAVAGNGILEQAQALGMQVQVVETDGGELIAVRRTDLATDDPRRVALALADNQLGQLSTWDEERVAAARRDLDADLLTATALPADLPDLGDDGDLGDTPPAGAGKYRFALGAYAIDIDAETYQRIIGGIPNFGDARVVAAELKRRIGL